MLLDTLGASSLGNILPRKGAIAKSISRETKSTSQGRGVNRGGRGAIANSISEETKSKRQGRGIVRVGYGNKKGQKTTKKYIFIFNATSSFN